MRLGILGLCAAALLTCTSAAIAADSDYGTTGNHLLSECRFAEKAMENSGNSDDLMRASACLSYLAGVRDAGDVFKASYKEVQMFCIPRTVTNGQLMQVFVRWAENAPQTLHMQKGMLVSAAFMNAWPCK